MTYDLDDVLRLMHGAPAFALAREKPFLMFVEKLEQAATECNEILNLYPQVKYEPLDFLYVSLQSLRALDVGLMSDLVEIGKKGAVWACWMAMLSPQPDYRAILDRIVGRDTHYRWCVDFAQSLIDNRVDPANAEHARLVASIRKAIAGLPLPKLDLRRVPTGEQLEQLRAQRDSILQRYREEGATAARAHAIQLGVLTDQSKPFVVNVSAEEFRARGIMMPVLHAAIEHGALEASGHLSVFRDCDDLDEYDAALFLADGIPMSWQRYDRVPAGAFTLAIDELAAAERGVDILQFGNRVLALLGIAGDSVVWRNPYFQIDAVELALV